MNNPSHTKMEEHKRKHKSGHKSGHKTKFSEDTPEDAIEKKDISSRVGNGVLTDKEALFGAPTAPSGTYVGESFDAATGDVVRFIGAKVPLYITSDVLDFEFVNYIKTDTAAMGEVVSRGKPPANEDKIVIMARTAAGRETLAKYKEPSELFARDSGAKPMLVRDYYLKKDGLKGQARGIRAEVTNKISASQTAQISAFADFLKGMVAGAPAAKS